MYKVEIPKTIRILIALYYCLGIWSDQNTFRERRRRCSYFIFALAFFTSTALEAQTTNDPDERIFLVVMSILFALQVYRFWLILWRRNEFFSLLRQVGTRCTDEKSEFDRLIKVLNVFMKFVRYCLIGLFTAVFVITLYPLLNEGIFVVNFQFPLDRTYNKIGFWIALVFYTGGCLWAGVCTCFTTINWYLMLSFSLEYKLLGRQLERMGTINIGESKLKPSLTELQNLFRKDLVDAMQNYNKINGILDEFGTHFGTLFFLQIGTGSLCICGAVYTLAFSSHGNLTIDAFDCAVLLYCIFDIFMVMYLGNEIVLTSDELSRCLYNSNWIDQTQSCKRCVIIFGERLKRPQELIVGKIYPLNLLTFTSILNGAYSMFNILQNLRE